MVKLATKPGRIILLTKEDRASIAHFEKISKAYVDRVAKTRESAMQELIDVGIYGKNGKLTKQYR